MAHGVERSRNEERWSGALDLILELTVLLNADMSQALAATGLTVSRTHLLWELLHRGPTVQRELAEAMGISARTVTGLVDGLVATGFVTREPHPTDRRATLVTFTERGAATMTAMAAEQREFARLLFAGMPAERFEQLVAGLGDVVACLREHGRPPQIGEDS